MNKVIRIDPFDGSSIDAAIQQLQQYKSWVAEKEIELLERLSEFGVTTAQVKFSSAIYDGNNDVTVHWVRDGTKATIIANGKSVAFIEFGSGYRYGYGHPLSGELGMGPGTWSDGPEGKGYWDDPNGWWYNHKHTWGNPPAMAMYDAIVKISESIIQIATEVFST